jgi:UDP-glucose 4-epimerase
MISVEMSWLSDAAQLPTRQLLQRVTSRVGRPIPRHRCIYRSYWRYRPSCWDCYIESKPLWWLEDERIKQFMTRVLVTGATGFVGYTLCEMLFASGYLIRVALRTDRSISTAGREKILIGDIDETTDWTSALTGVDSVIHLAARTHVLRDDQANSDLYFKTNASGTRNLAKASAEAGVRRFIYLSSIKVNGEQSIDRPFGPDDRPAPIDAYGRSKWQGEQAVAEVGARAGMEVVIVRSPLVYGAGVRANFLHLMQCIDRQWVLPLGAIDNRRSLVSVWNLCDLLRTVVRKPEATGKTWMVSDGEDMSTPELIRRIARAMDRRARLLPAPVGLLRLCGALIGRSNEISRLCGSLAIDISRTRTELGWSPQLSADEALARTAAWYFAAIR